jgi:hypothetical protein
MLFTIAFLLTAVTFWDHKKKADEPEKRRRMPVQDWEW